MKSPLVPPAGFFMRSWCFGILSHSAKSFVTGVGRDILKVGYSCL
jgi:hypothetical protein